MFTIWIYHLRVIITNKKYELNFFSSSEQEKHKILGESKSFYSQGTTISCLSKNKFYFGKNELNWNGMISAESEIDEMTTVWKEKKSLNPQN